MLYFPINTDDLPTPQSCRERLQLQHARKTKRNDLLDSDETASKVVESFFNQTFDPKKELEDQLNRNGKSKDNIDWQKVNDNKSRYISSLFDSLEWWKNVGRKKYCEVFIVMLAIAAVPASNGFQERIFSACTWFDDPLRQMQSDGEFEWSLLLSINDTLADALDE